MYPGKSGYYSTYAILYCARSFMGGGVNLKGLVPMSYETKKDTMNCLYFRHCNWQLALRDYSSRLRC